MSPAAQRRKQAFELLLESDGEDVELMHGSRRIASFAAILDRGGDPDERERPVQRDRDAVVAEFLRCSTPEEVVPGMHLADPDGRLLAVRTVVNTEFTVRCECGVTSRTRR